MAADIHNLFADQQEQLARLKRAVDSGGEPPDDGRMEARVAKLETDIAAIKIDIAVIMAHGATKSDFAELKGVFKSDLAEVKGGLKADIAEARAAIVMWVAGIVFLAQLVPAAIRLIEKYI